MELDFNRNKKELSEEEFYVWFENLCFLESIGDNIKISTPNLFHKNQIEKRFTKKIKEILIKNGYNNIVIVFTNQPPKTHSNKQETKNPALNETFSKFDKLKEKTTSKEAIQNIQDRIKMYIKKEEEEEPTNFKNPFLKKDIHLKILSSGQIINLLTMPACQSQKILGKNIIRV